MEATAQSSFALGACLGRGGFGEVYRATMTSPGGLRREVAVKLLRADLGLDDEAVRRLRDEGRLLARLDHPALLTVHDLVHLEGRIALVTELVDGEDLGDCIRAGMPPRALLQAIGAAADALAAAWTAPVAAGRPMRLAHRDIKPGNLRVSRHGQLKVLDFGIARTDELTREARTATDLIVGSPTYMAPERFLDTEVRSASDVFALGCCLYEGLAGRRLFGGATAMVLSTLALSRDRFERWIADRPLPSDVEPELARLVADCLAYEPDERPTAAQLARRCEDLADRVGGLTLRRWAREREWPTGAVGRAAGPVEPSAGTLRTEAPAPRTWRGWFWLAGGAGVAAAAALALGIAGAVGIVAWQGWSTPEAAGLVDAPGVRPDDALGAGPVDAPGAAPSTEPPIEAQPIAAAPRPAPISAPAPAPAPAPAAVAPAPAPAAAPAPEAAVIAPAAAADASSAAPSPAPPPPSPPAAAAAGTVHLSGSATAVALVRGDVLIPLGPVTEVPAGEWTVRSTEPLAAPLAPMSLRVGEGATVRLECSRAIQACRIR